MGFQGALWHTARTSLIATLLDSRGVDWPRSSNLIVVTLSSLKPFVFNGLNKALPSRTTLA